MAKIKYYNEETQQWEFADNGKNINVINNLESISSTDALSAYQGKVLNETKLNKTDALGSCDNIEEEELLPLTNITGFDLVNQNIFRAIYTLSSEVMFFIPGEYYNITIDNETFYTQCRSIFVEGPIPCVGNILLNQYEEVTILQQASTHFLIIQLDPTALIILIENPNSNHNISIKHIKTTNLKKIDSIYIPPASTLALGGVQAGEGVTIDENGIISVANSNPNTTIYEAESQPCGFLYDRPVYRYRYWHYLNNQTIVDNKIKLKELSGSIGGNVLLHTYGTIEDSSGRIYGLPFYKDSSTYANVVLESGQDANGDFCTNVCLEVGENVQTGECLVYFEMGTRLQ